MKYLEFIVGLIGWCLAGAIVAQYYKEHQQVKQQQEIIDRQARAIKSLEHEHR